MKGKSAKAVSIIGGSDGPTSIFIVGRTKEKNIFRQIRNEIRQAKIRNKRRKVIANIKAEPHSLEEVCAYIKDKYDVQEIDAVHYRYKSSYLNVKAAVIYEYKPELLAEERVIDYPAEDLSNKKAMEEYIENINEQAKRRMQQIKEAEIPIDFHAYIIPIKGSGEINIEIEKIYNFMGAGYSTDKGKAKYLEKIMKDIYLYYGVTQKDIDTESRRYKSLIAALST